MTDEEAAAAFRADQESIESDAEGKHVGGDDFLIQFLKAHGYPLLAAVYEAETEHWWYA